MCFVKHLEVSRCLFLTFWRHVLRTFSKHPQDVNFEPLVQMHFHCVIFNFISQNVFLKHQRVSCFIVLGFWKFWKDVLKTSYKGPKVTSCRWRTRDVPRRPILNINTKRIYVVIHSVLVHQMSVLDTKTLIIAYFLSFGETSYERPKNVQKWHLQHDVLGTSSGRQFRQFP